MLGRRRERFLEAYAFPEGLELKLATSRPELRATDRALVMDGLRDWFRICRSRRRRFLAVPSRAVDDAWHEFILFTRDYRRFCRRALGRYLDHTPAEGLSGGASMETGMLAAWDAACALEGIDPRSPDRLPRIFAIDERVGIEDGFRYELDRDGPQPFRVLRRSEAVAGAAWVPALGLGCGGGAFAGCGGGSSGSHGGGGGSHGGDGGCGGGCGGGG